MIQLIFSLNWKLFLTRILKVSFLFLNSKFLIFITNENSNKNSDQSDFSL